MSPVEDWVKELTEDVIGGSPLQVGHRYMHPEHGLIEVTSGQYWGGARAVELLVLEPDRP